MKFFGGRELPDDIFLDPMSEFITTKALLNMRLVCKNWRDLVDTDSVWWEKLRNEGLTSEQINLLKEKLSFTNFQLYKFLNTNDLFFSKFEAQDPKWLEIKLDDDLLSFFNKNNLMILRNSSLEFNREKFALECIFNMNPKFYKARAEYALSKITEKFYPGIPIDITDLLKNITNSTLIKEGLGLANNDKLYESLMLFNHRDSGLFTLRDFLMMLSGYKIEIWNGEVKKEITHFIRSTNSVIAVWEFEEVSTIKVGEMKLENPDKSFNFKSEWTIEIFEDRWQLLNYKVFGRAFNCKYIQEVFNDATKKLADALNKSNSSTAHKNTLPKGTENERANTETKRCLVM